MLRAGRLSLENLDHGGADVLPLAEGHASDANDVGSAADVLPGRRVRHVTQCSLHGNREILGSASLERK